MGKIVNRRNALLGWAVWTYVRRRMRRKASQTVEAAEEKLGLDEAKPRRRRLGALVVGALSAVGVVAVWRKLRGGDEESSASAPDEPTTTEPTPLSSLRDEDDDVPPAA